MKSLLIAGVTFSVLLSAISSSAVERLNVLMIAVDDLRPQLGCYGDTLVQSPQIDRLAARGLIFERAYCQQALCSPSRISLLSGRRPSTSKIYQIGPTLRSHMPEIVTLPQHFKNSGYFTRSLGKIYHVGIDDPPSWSVASWQSNKPRYGPQGMKQLQQRREEYAKKGQSPPQRGDGAIFYAGPAFEAPEVGDEDLLDGDTAREAIAALRELARKPEQPFFLAVGFANPHVPWVAPKKYWDLYESDQLPLPENRYAPRSAPRFAAQTGADFFWYGNVPKDRKITDEFGRKCLHGYLAAISYIDAQVGRLLRELDRLSLRDHTVVILWGDHGYYMGEHDWWGGKHNNYEGATRSPLIVAVPGMPSAGRKSRALVEFVDIYPSLAEICGLTPMPDLEGTSFAPLLQDPQRAWKRAAFSEYPKGGYQGMAMRTDRYRYVEWKDKQGKVAATELYDEQTDPQENQNIIAEADPALVNQLAGQFRGYWQAARPK